MGVTSVSSDDGRDDETDLRALYAGTYRRLVGVVGAVADNRDVAEEAVQDAFVRLIKCWDRVSRYDDPEAWVRRAAFGYLSNYRRKVRNGLAAARRQAVRPVASAGPTADAVDLAAALGRLPIAQRAVVVLQALGLSIEEIARDLDVPVGTVKSRLSRARAALAPLLREESDHVRP